IMADDVPVSLTIPAWAKFTFPMETVGPQEPVGAEEA
ncbi:MAG: folate-binding protein, partial [Mesorhizobium sp.]